VLNPEQHYNFRIRQRILRETLLQYNAMQKSNIELLAAKEREQLGEREAIDALRDYWMARAHVESAVGGSLTRDVPPVNPTAPPAKQNESKEHQHNH
jgi:cobalt-zinc-cadmium efflux system outer membrane protein